MIYLPDNTSRLKNCLVAFYILAFVQLAFIVSSFMQYFLLKRMQSGNFTQEEATANDVRHQAIAYVNVAVYLICIVLFILWFRRAYNNLNLTERVRTRFAEGWAAGAWFVPIINLGRPYFIMQEIWQKTQQATDNLISYRTSKIIGWWWALWIITTIGNNFITRYFKESNVDELITSTTASLVFNFMEMIALVLLIIIMKTISDFETNLQASLLTTEESNGEDLLNFVID